MRPLLLALLLGSFLLSFMSPAQAQDHRLLTVDHPAYFYLERLQRRGHLLELHPTALPYTEGAVRQALDALDEEAPTLFEARWVRLLHAMLGPAAPDDAALVGFRGETGLRAINSERLDLLRPVGEGEPLLPTIALQGYLESGPVIGHLGIRYDLYYKTDPDGLRAARRLLTRSEDTYVGLDTGLLSLYLGRYHVHWGRPDAPSVLLSANPRSFDQIALRFGGERLALRSLLGELDNISPEGQFTGEAYRQGSQRRYVAAHRIDWRPSRHVALTLMESAVYAGPGAGPSLKYLTPLHTIAFVIGNKPRNDEDNGLLAGMLWAQAGRFTLHGQALLDDFDFVNGQEPASLAFVGALTYSARTLPLDLGAEATVVTARAYNSPQPEVKYLYLRRGLALPFNDYVQASLRADAYLDTVVPGLTLSPQLHVLAQGQASILDAYPPSDSVDTILSGTVQRTLRPALQLRLQPVPWGWLRLDLGVNVTDNADFVEDAQETQFVGLVEAGLRLRLDRPYRLSF